MWYNDMVRATLLRKIVFFLVGDFYLVVIVVIINIDVVFSVLCAFHLYLANTKCTVLCYFRTFINYKNMYRALMWRSKFVVMMATVVFAANDDDEEVWTAMVPIAKFKQFLREAMRTVHCRAYVLRCRF